MASFCLFCHSNDKFLEGEKGIPFSFKREETRQSQNNIFFFHYKVDFLMVILLIRFYFLITAHCNSQQSTIVNRQLSIQLKKEYYCRIKCHISPDNWGIDRSLCDKSTKIGTNDRYHVQSTVLKSTHYQSKMTATKFSFLTFSPIDFQKVI